MREAVTEKMPFESMRSGAILRRVGDGAGREKPGVRALGKGAGRQSALLLIWRKRSGDGRWWRFLYRE